MNFIVQAPLPHRDIYPRESTQSDQRSSAVVYAEVRLDAWATWAREYRGALGYPKVSMIYKVLRRKSMRLGGFVERPCLGKEDRPIGLLTAKGSETVSFKPREVGDVPEAIAQIDRVVATMDRVLRRIIQIEYLTSSDLATEQKALTAGMQTSQYRTLLRKAKRAVASALEVLPDASKLC